MEYGNFLKKALKYNAPLTLVIFLLVWLLHPIYSNIELISHNPKTSIFLVLIIANFSVIALWLTNKKEIQNNVFEDNIIEGNKAKKNIKISSSGNIRKNKIKNNETDGELVIGKSDKDAK